jgi:hypothetical protein
MPDGHGKLLFGKGEFQRRPRRDDMQLRHLFVEVAKGPKASGAA